MSKRKEFLIKEGRIKRDKTLINTFTSTFLLPLIKITSSDFGKNFINAYIHNVDKPCIYVVCSYNEEDDNLMRGIVRSRINPNFIETEIKSDEIILKFTIPQESLNIFQLFIEGKYSQFPEKYKRYLCSIYGVAVEKETRYASVYNVLYPQDYKRKQIADFLKVDKELIKEVLDIPDMNYENYKDIEELEEKIYEYEQ